MVPHDGNSAVAHVAHATNEVIAIYPITPSSPMGEISDAKSAVGEKNIWGTVPIVSELQSEGGASGAVHGALSSGSLVTTFTASQGLMLMYPNMNKIAGELLSTVFHVSARSIACQALSIFGDHSDVMGARNSGFGLLASGSVQEAHDFALISQEATLAARVPFVHFFEGFRVSHEISKIAEICKDEMKKYLDQDLVRQNRMRGMSPERPVVRGTSQNPDVFMQGRESVNKFYDECPGHVQAAMDKFAKQFGREYHIFDYVGAKDAEYVMIIMGSGWQAAQEAVEHLNGKGEKLGLIKVRLYRPWDASAFVKCLPATVKGITVLDRTKEPGALGEPLYEDVVTTVRELSFDGRLKLNQQPIITGGRYGLGSKEFTGAMVKGVFDELKKAKPKNHYTVGIVDDVTNTHIEYDPNFNCENDDVTSCQFWGLGSDGTVGANKNSIKIIADTTDNDAQGYFVYDSKKAGARTVSHLRFGKKKILSNYLITKANFLACHNFSFLEKYDMTKDLKEGGTFLLNSPVGADKVWDELPKEMQKDLIDKKAKFYVIDAIDIAREVGLGERINVVMQTAFFKISGILPVEDAVKEIKDAIKKTYGKKGEKIVSSNCAAVDKALEAIHEVKIPDKVTSTWSRPPVVPEHAPAFVKETSAKIIAMNGDDVKVSEMPADGSWPLGTTQYEKRNVALDIPVWNTDTCVQCNQCSLVCPHAAIRAKVVKPEALDKAPATLKSVDAKGKDFKGMKYILQVAPEDCTGCGTCVYNCPAKAKEAIKMSPQRPLRDAERENYAFFLELPEVDPELYNPATLKGSQFKRPLFEYSGACAGCGETAYVKLLSQLFGDRAIIANATGCSSIYGGNLPTTPYTTDDCGRGPAWNNSLFEDNAEIAFGMRLTADKQTTYAYELVEEIAKEDGSFKELAEAIKGADQTTEPGIQKQRARVAELNKKLEGMNSETAKNLKTVSEYLVKRSVWALGGDGWAYDIGYGGLDHVLASGKNVNVLVLDTEVYSNTGGQASKSTPRGAVAKFADGGKPLGKKDMALIAMTYGDIYVAKVAMGANPAQCVKAFVEAEAHPGPSLILAYSHCIAHGINMTEGLGQQKAAVESGHWPLLRYNPALAAEGKNPLSLDSKQPSRKVEEYAYNENRFRVLKKKAPETAKDLMDKAQHDADMRWKMYSWLAEMKFEE